MVADKQGAGVVIKPRSRAHSGHVSRHCVHHVCTRDGNAWQLLQNARIPRLASVASILFLFPVLDALGRSCPLTHRKIRTPSDDPSGWVVWACRPASRHFPKPKSVDAALRVATAKDSKGFLSVGALSFFFLQKWHIQGQLEPEGASSLSGACRSAHRTGRCSRTPWAK